ncbi:hypothetical protein SAMN02799631_00639 [Methylobacterium sp. 174MFSha1.1]|uniref:hypothetical protein n=1 Tax=Methylobacterium sp. 174MFSha1.1 TaxID=1502749 RepID=UPI0008F44417|nr:hypothetical protein [Methylobacterium sp. 174MFSha1.1]SFU42744.1 hypothetical protein SAMN02799631_00639 [Methylobacterium sp. 174MFSha1.1]
MTNQINIVNIDLKIETIRILKQAAQFYEYMEEFNNLVDGQEYGYGMLVIECKIGLMNIDNYIYNNRFICHEYYDAIYATAEAYHEQLTKCYPLLAFDVKAYLNELKNFKPQ